MVLVVFLQSEKKKRQTKNEVNLKDKTKFELNILKMSLVFYWTHFQFLKRLFFIEQYTLFALKTDKTLEGKGGNNLIF